MQPPASDIGRNVHVPPGRLLACEATRKAVRPGAVEEESAAVLGASRSLEWFLSVRHKRGCAGVEGMCSGCTLGATQGASSSAASAVVRVASTTTPSMVAHTKGGTLCLVRYGSLVPGLGLLMDGSRKTAIHDRRYKHSAADTRQRYLGSASAAQRACAHTDATSFN